MAQRDPRLDVGALLRERSIAAKVRKAGTQAPLQDDLPRRLERADRVLGGLAVAPDPRRVLAGPRDRQAPGRGQLPRPGPGRLVRPVPRRQHQPVRPAALPRRPGRAACSARGPTARCSPRASARPSPTPPRSCATSPVSRSAPRATQPVRLIESGQQGELAPRRLARRRGRAAHLAARRRCPRQHRRRRHDLVPLRPCRPDPAGRRRGQRRGVRLEGQHRPRAAPRRRHLHQRAAPDRHAPARIPRDRADLRLRPHRHGRVPAAVRGEARRHLVQHHRPHHPARRCRPDPEGTWSLDVTLPPTCIRIAAGHRLRLQVSSGAFPLYARHPGTAEAPGTATDYLVASQTVHHQGARLTLPLRLAGATSPALTGTARA